MTTIRKATAHRRRVDALWWGLGLLWMGGVALIVLPATFPVHPGMAVLLHSAAFIVLWLWLSRRMQAAFRCPDCGGPVEDATPATSVEGDPVLRRCSRCTVLWDVGQT